jgi:hypothetical protein
MDIINLHGLINIDDFEDIVNEPDLHLQQLVRQPVMRERRADHMVVLSDAEFKRTFRFTKPAVDVIVDMVFDELHLPSNRGLPLSVLQQVLIALNHYAGGQFQRVTALCGGVSQATVCRVIHRVSMAICNHLQQHIRMPSEQQMSDTAQNMLERFDLPKFAFAVDGMMVRFDTAPRNIPANTRLQEYWCRKGFYALNCQVVCNDESLILNIDCDWPGSTHDARIWAWSAVRQYLEGEPGHFYLMAGDSAYPISTALVKPYTNAEAVRDASMRLFNGRLSGLRTVMSENVFALLKHRFPVLRNIRGHLPSAKIVVLATAVLHNIAIKIRQGSLFAMKINPLLSSCYFSFRKKYIPFQWP